ncbi:MAG: glycosyltransferase family 2 protein [Candidatus Sumerlaeaceae bacterium]
MRKLSVVIPVYRGERTIAPLVTEVLEKLVAYDPEIVLVNDGSPDGSEAVCEELAHKYASVKFISLRRNFGENNAVMCGLNFVEAEYAAVIDDDFQNPPSEIVKLLDEAEKGYDVVYSKYRVKHHHWFRNFGSRLHNYMATFLLNKPPNLYLSSFRLIRNDVIQEIIKYRGPFPYIDGLILRVTNNFSSVYVEHAGREDGKSTYTFSKLVGVWLNMFLNFSIKPLRVFTFSGFVIFVLGLLMSVYFVVEKLLNPAEQMGWTSLMVSILTLSGIQLMFVGLMGEYLGKAYLDVNGTPQWVIRKKVLGGRETP